ncbi:MAG: hypothetical protein ACOYIK_02475 [Coriobacteriales bacterium]|jgi:glucose-6-phosphate isomerase
MSYDSISIPQSAIAQKLIDIKAASRLASGDATLFGFSEEAEDFAKRFTGWTTLCTKPPYDPRKVMEFAEAERGAGLEDVLIIGQGGSTQASMTMASLLDNVGRLDIGFHTMDCLSPEFVRSVLDSINPARTIVVVSSKSGTTIEPTMMFKCIWEEFVKALGPEKAGKRFVAITDPGSQLEKTALQDGFAAVFPGEPTVGGRFSALSVFGLVPFALMGMDVCALVDYCAEAERKCSLDSMENPALRLASYLKESVLRGRDKLSFNFSESCAALGMWLEQLIAESTGKDGWGILPNTESDVSLLQTHNSDRFAIAYTMECDRDRTWPDGTTQNGEKSVASIIDYIPIIEMTIDSPEDAARHFVVWEYAISMASALLELNPFDQPDVESTKIEVRKILSGDHGKGVDAGDYMVFTRGEMVEGYEVSEILIKPGQQPRDLDDILGVLFSSMKKGDYFSLNAFLPVDEERHQILESMRHDVAKISGCPACLEMGPRYLHSIGQYQKGGKNRGVFLILSSEEEDDIQIPGESFGLAYLASSQARGDFLALNMHMRRAAHIHLVNNSPDVLKRIAEKVRRHVPSRL